MYVVKCCGAAFHTNSIWPFMRTIANSLAICVQPHLCMSLGDEFRLKMITHWCYQLIFRSKYSLKRHTQIHRNEKNFECDECGKKFLQKAHLKSHSRQHGIGLAPHQCHICDKEFVMKSSLKVHMWLHLGGVQRPLTCDYTVERDFCGVTNSKHIPNWFAHRWTSDGTDDDTICIYISIMNKAVVINIFEQPLIFMFLFSFSPSSNIHFDICTEWVWWTGWVVADLHNRYS